jgi:hypothetical protein
MSCPADRPAPLRCPALEESIDATVKLLPRGRAWPVNDGGSTMARFLAWLAVLSSAPVVDTWPVGFVQAGYFAAVGAVRNYLETRLCALRLEFWCATHSETRDLWMLEYGLPDDCDPFPDLCTKVAATGGATCDYLNSIVSRIGWRVDCLNMQEQCGAKVGCSRAGTARAGWSRRVGLVLRVHTGELPLPTRRSLLPRVGCFRAGRRPSCAVAPSIAPVRCLMDRIAPAHAVIEYVT